MRGCDSKRGNPWDQLPQAEALVAAEPHKQYKDMSLADLTAKLKAGGVFTDVKTAYDPAAIKTAGFKLWRL